MTLQELLDDLHALHPSAVYASVTIDDREVREVVYDEGVVRITLEDEDDDAD